MNPHNFLLVNCDTDSITICKPDMTPFTEDENNKLMDELNSLFPKNISWEDDGMFDFFAVLKAKNYIMYDGKKIKLKGSGIKDQKKEPRLRHLLDTMIEDLVKNDGKNLIQLYTDCVKEALNPTDIKQWCQKKTVTKPILECADNDEARKNERDVYNAIKDKQVQEGDKIYVYPAILEINREETTLKNGKVKIKETKVTGLKCDEDWNNDHDTLKLVDRVYATVLILSNIVGEDFFIDYGLKKNYELLENLK